MMASDRPARESNPDAPIPLAPIPAPPVADPTQPKPSALLNGLDVFQAAGVVLLAFLVASFAVRNTDFLQHLAAGRLISEGSYSFGTDPFSHTTEGKTWVNHAWLFDIFVYQMFTRLGGASVVIFKGIVVALLAALLLTTRKSTHPLWFAVVGVGLALLSMAPRLLMQPAVLSFLFLGMTLWGVTHWSRSTDRKRLPIAVGILFALWSNCDQWFFLGPLSLGLILLGELIPFRLGDKTDDRFDRKTLGLALAVGVLACMVNPYHVNVWELPEVFNVQAMELLADDAELSVPFLGLRSPTYFDLAGTSRVANPINSYALLFLFLFAATSFAFNALHLRWGHLFLFVAFAVMAANRFRLVPFFAVVAVVVSSWNYGEFAARLMSKPISPTLAGLFGFPRFLARTATLLVGLGLIVAVRPGALNQEPRDPLRARWLTWEVEFDEGLAPAARTLQKWRDEGKLPKEAKALVSSPDMAAYLNWFAPAEKTFADGRLNLHEDHLGDFALIRSWLRGKLEAKDASSVPKILEKHGITHLILGSADRLANFQQAGGMLTAGNPLRPEWTVWNLEGRVWVLGWNGQKSLPPKTVDRLAFDPIRSTFGPDAEKVDEPRDVIPFGVPGWIEAYWDIPTRAPSKIDDALSFWGYQLILRQQAGNRFRAGLSLSMHIAGAPLPMAVAGLDPVAMNHETSVAATLRSIRAGRAATVANPDSSDAFLMLARAYDGRYPALPEMGEPAIVANTQRGLLRAVPATASDLTRSEQFEAMNKLCDRYRNMQPVPRLDLMVPLIRKAESYRDYRLRFSPAEREETIQYMKRPFGGKDNGPTPQEALDNFQTTYEHAITGLDDNPLTRAMIARLIGLPSEAYEILTRIEIAEADSQGVLKAVVDLDAAQTAAETGHYEEAYKRIKEIDRLFGDRMSDPEFLNSYQLVRRDMAEKISPRLQRRVQLDFDIRQSLRSVKVRVCYVLGKFAEAIQEDQFVLSELEKNYLGKIDTGLEEKQRKLGEKQIAVLLTQYLYEPTWVNRFGSEAIRWIRNEEIGRANNDLQSQFQALETVHFLHVRVGLMNLEKGDNAEARFHFEQAMKPIGVNYVGRFANVATAYLRLFDAAK